MALYEITKTGFTPIERTTFGAERISERADLQRLLRDNIDVIAPRTMVLAEEFADWDASRRRIDLLCLDEDANLVVVELKRTEDGGHVDLQAIRYAAMVSTRTFEQAVRAHADYLARRGDERDAQAEILAFLGLDEPDEDSFGKKVHIVLVSADFSKEITTSVLWLNEHDLEIRCVRLRPYRFADRVVLDIQQIVPLREAEEFQVKVREKARAERQAQGSGPDRTRYDVTIRGATHEHQYKRDAVLVVVRELCHCGTTPDEIAAAITCKSRNHLWLDVDGVHDSASFEATVRREDAEGGRRFDRRRWAYGDGELIHHGGRTYAFSNQWGPNTITALEELARRFPSAGIRYEPSK